MEADASCGTNENSWYPLSLCWAKWERNSTFGLLFYFDLEKSTLESFLNLLLKEFNEPALQQNTLDLCLLIYLSLSLLRFRVTKCEKTARERRTLLITDSNKAVPTSPAEVEPKSRTTSESQQVCIMETSSSGSRLSPSLPAVLLMYVQEAPQLVYAHLVC